MLGNHAFPFVRIHKDGVKHLKNLFRYVRIAKIEYIPLKENRLYSHFQRPDGWCESGLA